MYSNRARSASTSLAMLIVGCSVAFGAEPAAPGVDDFQARAEAVMASIYPADQPGAAAIVARDGEVLFRGARGLADVELGIPLEPDMVFRLGSITKQFTAAAAMKLVEDGKLALDDPLTKYLPDYPTQGKTITVEHLLTHTSGIQSYTNMPGWMQTKIKTDMTLDELIDGFDDEPMEFDPGSAFNYNNSGYVLLGAVIEKASGKSYEAYVEEEIFAPLGMKWSRYGHHAEIVPRRVSGYDGDPSAPVNAQYLSMSQPYAAGSLLSSVDDLAIWTDALFDHRVVGEASLSQMTTPFTLTDGNPTGYGYGFSFGDVRGKKTVEHGGGIFGFSTMGIYVPEADLYVAVLSNVTGRTAGPRMAAAQLAALALGDPFPARERVAVSTETLERYAGIYRIDEQSTRAVTARDGKLYTQRDGGSSQEAIPSSETRFFYETSMSWFDIVVDASGKVTGMEMHQNGAEETERAEWTDEKVEARKAIELSDEQIAALVGTYQLGPDFLLEIRHEGGAIVAQATGQGAIPVQAQSPDTLYSELIGGTLKFDLGEDGRATALTLHQGGQVVPAKRVE